MLHLVYVAVKAIKAAGAAAHGTAGVAHGTTTHAAGAVAHGTATHSAFISPIVPGAHTTAIAQGGQAAGGGSTAAAFLHTVESHAAHTASSHASHLANTAGKVAANRLASGGSHTLGATSVRAIPVPFTAHGTLAIPTGTLLEVGGFWAGGKALEKLVQSFAEGFISQTAKNVWKAHVDMRNIKSWFTKNPEASKQALMFTATGKVDGIFFRPAPPRGGPCTILQGYFDPISGRMTAGRIIHQATSVTEKVLSNHRATGLAVYAKTTS